MSGIAGIVRFDGGPVDRELLEKMADFQAFRGPHGRGVWCDGNVGFVHTLFKLNDDDAPAPQPLTLDGKVWITAHARIDAQDELIPALRGRGREVAKGASDAELLLHAYHAWGERCLERLLGDFTFAIWDGRERRLFCAVDHFGIRPFYYSKIGDTLAFSNTLECVRLLESISKRLDDTAIGDFLLFGRYVDLDRTIYADVRRIPRASGLITSRSTVDVRRYWEMIEEPELDDSDAEALVAEFKFRLQCATRDRLRARSVAVSMSGGLDSTLVTATAIGALSMRDDFWCVTPFTSVFEELIPDDEKRFASAAAKHLDLELRLQSSDNFVPFDWVERCNWHPPEPTTDAGWSLYLRGVAEWMRAAPLVLTGWEGDEPLRAWLPGRWRRLIQSGRWERLINDLTWYVRNEMGPPPVGARTGLIRLRRWLHGSPLPNWIAPDFARRMDLATRWAELHDAQSRAFHLGSRQQYLECVPWAEVLDGYDAGWTGCAVEIAHPLMDLRVIAWVARVPPIPWCVGKRLFRMAGREVLPKAILQRPKTGVSVDVTDVALRKCGMRVPRGFKEIARRTEYVVADKLFASEQTIRDERPAKTYANAVSFLAWLHAGQNNKIAHEL